MTNFTKNRNTLKVVNFSRSHEGEYVCKYVKSLNFYNVSVILKAKGKVNF
jgi:hypothetical protein